MMAYLVIRLHGDEDWDAWGDDWWDHVERVGELHWLQLSNGAAPGPSRWLDWGASLREASAEDIRRIAWEPPWLADTESAREQRELLEMLTTEGRYGLVSVEIY
jgi:hypothetical protein